MGFDIICSVLPDKIDIHFFDSPKAVFKTVERIGYACAPSYNLPATVKGIYSPYELFSGKHRTRGIIFRIGSNT